MASLAHSSDLTTRNHKEKVRQFQKEHNLDDGNLEARIESLFKKWHKTTEHA